MLFLMKAWKLVYENKEGGGEEEGGDEGGDAGKGKPNLTGLIEKHGLQDELNAMMATNRKKLTQQNSELITQLKKIRDESKMTSESRDELEVRIEQLQEQYMSKDELAKREVGKTQKTHQAEVEKLTSATKKWQGLYASSTTQRALLDAAVKGEAVQPGQIVAMLGQNTHIVEELDGTGQPLGTYRPLVKFNDINEDGKPVVLDLSPDDAIKRMKELPDMFGNLFKGSAAGGLGGTGGGGTGKGTSQSLTELLKDPVKYQEWRKKNPDLDISKLRK